MTHADLDHVGSLAAIQKETDCVVYASAATAVHLKNGTFPEHLPRLMQFIVDRFFRYETVAETAVRLFSDGDSLPFLGGLEVLATPGHTPDHHAFFSSLTGVMFSGDALNTRKGALQASPDRVSADLAQVIQSVRKILNRNPAVIACGHGPPAVDHSSSQVMKLFNQLRKKEASL